MKNYRSTPIQLNENIFKTDQEISDEIQILRVGTFLHEGKTLEITKKDLRNMVTNFANKVRGIDLMLDYGHKSSEAAAAWFEELYLDETGKELWAKVSWTDDGADSVRKRNYRYISADFSFNYRDSESLKEFGPTLFGAAMTNRPFIKDMEATLSEETNTKENNMELEELKKKFAELQEENKKLKGQLQGQGDKDKEKALSEREDKIAAREESIKLAEEKAIEDKKLAEKKGRFDTMLSEGKTIEAQRDAFMNDDMDEFVKNSPTEGTLNLSEKGHGSNNSSKEFAGSETPAQDEVISLAEKKMESHKIDISSAIEIILSENKSLNEKYQKEVEV